MNEIKRKAQAAWQAADYATFATCLERGLDDFAPRIDLRPGHALLDIACGSGNIDFNPDALAVAAERLETAGLTARLDRGDIENMPYEGDRFDWAVSVFGIMFATDSERAAAELIRVCKPGGRFAVTSWTSDSLIGELARTLARYKPAEAGTARTSKWGEPVTIRQLFGGQTSDLQIVERNWRYEFPYDASGVVEFFRKYSGSHIPLFATLLESEQQSLRHDLEQVWTAYNLATDGTVCADAGYLEIIGTVK